MYDWYNRSKIVTEGLIGIVCLIFVIALFQVLWIVGEFAFDFITIFIEKYKENS